MEWLVAFLVGYFFVIFGSLAYVIVVECFLFKKAGEKPGKLFIPVYGAYLRFELFYDGSMFWAMFVLSILGNLFGSFLGASAAAVVSLMVSGFALVINILYCVSLARSFGKSGGFAVGLIFLYPIFASILAFGKAQYGGERRENLKDVTGWRCECGNMNSPGSTVCDRCGAEKKKLPETTWVCECGNINSVNKVYCDKCGEARKGF